MKTVAGAIASTTVTVQKRVMTSETQTVFNHFLNTLSFRLLKDNGCFHSSML